MKTASHIRAFLRPVNGLPIEVQRKMAADAGCGVVYEHSEWGKARNERDMWARSFRPGDTAWVARLDVLGRRKGEGDKKLRVGADLAALLAEIVARGAILVEGATGIKSTDSKAFADRVGWAVQRAHLASRTSKKIRSAVAKARAARQPGIVARWSAPAMASERRKALIIWTSHEFTSDEEAIAALPDELAKTSTPTIRRLLGRRRPGKRK